MEQVKGELRGVAYKELIKELNFLVLGYGIKTPKAKSGGMRKLSDLVREEGSKIEESD